MKNRTACHTTMGPIMSVPVRRGLALAGEQREQHRSEERAEDEEDDGLTPTHGSYLREMPADAPTCARKLTAMNTRSASAPSVMSDAADEQSHRSQDCLPCDVPTCGSMCPPQSDRSDGLVVRRAAEDVARGGHVVREDRQRGGVGTERPAQFQPGRLQRRQVAVALLVADHAAVVVHELEHVDAGVPPADRVADRRRLTVD